MNCIKNNDLLTAEQKTEIEKLINDYKSENAGSMDVANLEAAAKDHAIKVKEIEAVQKKLDKVRQIKIWKEISDQIDEGVRRGLTPQAAAESRWTIDPSDTMSQNSIEARHWYLANRAFAHFGEDLVKARPTILNTAKGIANPQQDLNSNFTAREAYDAFIGRAVDNPDAVAWANGARKATRHSHTQFKASGGRIGDMGDEWNGPHQWDAGRIQDVDKSDFVEDLYLHLDRTRTKDAITGEPLSATKAKQLLEYVYDTISTNGLNKVGVVSKGASKTLANMHDNARQLHFKTGSWYEINEKYGRENFMGSIYSYVDHMSRDTAQIQMLGKDTDLMVEQIKLKVQKETPDMGKGRQAAKDIQNLHDQFTGAAMAPHNEALARSTTAIRNVLTSAYLGASVIPAVSGDTLTAQVMARYNKIPAMMMIDEYIHAMKTGGRELAVELELGFDTAINSTISAAKYVNEISSNSRRLPELLLRGIGLEQHTQAGVHAAGMSMLRTLARETDKTFEQLHKKHQRFLDTYGVDADGWNKIRNADKINRDGHDYLSPNAIARVDQDVAIRFHQGVLSEARRGVIVSSLRTERNARLKTKKGTLMGELTDSALMFKRFPLTLWHNVIRRGLTSPRMSKTEKSVYSTTLFFGLWSAGMVALQAQQVIAGREPLPMDDPKTWTAALIKGGGLSILGDLGYAAFGDQNKGIANQTLSDRSVYEYFFGPVGNLFFDAKHVVGTAIKGAADGEDVETILRETGAEAWNRTYQNLPFRSTFYLRLGLERYLHDTVESFINPDGAEERWDRLQDRAEEDRNQGYWWKHGEMSP